MTDNPNQETSISVKEQVQPAKKCFRLMHIPAVIALAVMIAVFLVTFYTSTHRFSILKGLFGGPYAGNWYYRNAFDPSSGDVFRFVKDSLLIRILILAVSGLLSAGMYALYRCIKKPNAILWISCLWLIPASLPTAVTAFSAINITISWKIISNSLVYVLGSGLQTTGLFCFITGLFAYFGRNPFRGLLTAALVWLLGSLTLNALYPLFSITKAPERTLDYIVFYKIRDSGYSHGSTIVVIKVVLQALIAIIPMILLCRMDRENISGEIQFPEKTARAEYLLIPGALICASLIFLVGLTKSIENMWIRCSVNSLILALAGGGLGGLTAWSIIRFLRDASTRLFGITAIILSAAMSSMITVYLLSVRLSMISKMLPQVLSASFDWRMILLMIAIGFVLRFRSCPHPVILALSLALLAAAFTWANLTLSLFYEQNTNATIGSLFLSLIRTEPISPSKYLQCMLLTALPPLAFGLCGSLLMHRALTQD